MNHRKITIATLAGVVGVLAACQGVSALPTGEVQQSAAPAGDVLDVRAAMVEGVNPAALEIWDIGNSAMTDDGGLDPELMDAAAWARLHEAAQSLAIYSHRMAEAGTFRASGPDLVGGEVPEGVAPREEIQAKIDANPAGFRALSAEMGRQAQAIAEAAAAKDLQKTGELVFAFDAVCQTCHEGYWYPSE